MRPLLKIEEHCDGRKIVHLRERCTFWFWERRYGWSEPEYLYEWIALRKADSDPPTSELLLWLYTTHAPEVLPQVEAYLNALAIAKLVGATS